MKKKCYLLLLLVTFLNPIFSLVSCSKNYNDQISIQEENLLSFVKDRINLAFAEFVKNGKNFFLNYNQLISEEKIVEKLNNFAHNKEQKNHVFSQNDEFFEKVIQYIDSHVIKPLNASLQNEVTSLARISNVVKIVNAKSLLSLKHSTKVKWNKIVDILKEKNKELILEQSTSYEFFLDLNFQINLGTSRNYEHSFIGFELFLVNTEGKILPWIKGLKENIAKNLKFNLATWKVNHWANKPWKDDLLQELKNIGITEFNVNESEISLETYKAPSLGNFFDGYSKMLEVSQFKTLLSSKTKGQFLENLSSNINLGKDSKNDNPLYNKDKDDDNFLQLGFVTLKIKKAHYKNTAITDLILEKVPLILQKSKFEQSIIDMSEVLFNYFAKLFTISDNTIVRDTRGLTDSIILKITQKIWEDYPDREKDKNSPLVTYDDEFLKMINKIAKDSSAVYVDEIRKLWPSNSHYEKLASSIKINIKNGNSKNDLISSAIKENWRFSVYHFDLDMQINYFNLNFKIIDGKLAYFASLINGTFCNLFAKEECVKLKTLTPIYNTDTITMV